MKDMLDKLVESYSVNQKLGNFGYLVGFWNSFREKLLEKCEFENGTYEILKIPSDKGKKFIHFYYSLVN